MVGRQANMRDMDETERTWNFQRNIFDRSFRFYTRLSSEQERMLLIQAQQGNLTSRNEFVLSHWRLARWMAGKFFYSGFCFGDIAQWVFLRLMRAIEKFDANQGSSFSTYAVVWMYQVVQRAIADQGRTIRRPTYLVQIENSLWTIQKELEGPDTAAFEAIAGKVDPQIPTRLIYKAYWDLHLPDVPLTDSISYRSQILNPEQYLLAKEEVLDICREIKEKLLVKLPFRQSRDQGIFRMRYGLDGSMRIHTLEEVGTFYGVTRERVRQIEFKGWRKLMKRAAEVSENWLFVRLKTINRLEDLLGEDLAEEIFRSDHPSELKKIRFTGQKISQRKEVKMNLGQKNDLAVFLRERRAHLGKSQKQIALALGMPPNQYSQYESRGFLPRDPERLQKLANALEVSVEKVLMKKGHQKPAADSDILPLIKAIAESGCQKFFLDDLHFLLQTQQGLRTPMTAEIVAALLRHRS